MEHFPNLSMWVQARRAVPALAVVRFRPISRVPPTRVREAVLGVAVVQFRRTSRVPLMQVQRAVLGVAAVRCLLLAILR